MQHAHGVSVVSIVKPQRGGQWQTRKSKDSRRFHVNTTDHRTLFVNIQHPGNGDPLLTNFPAQQDGLTVPRDCTVVITRKDGGIIGS